MAKGQPTSSVAAVDLENEIQKQARKALRKEIEALIAPWCRSRGPGEEQDDDSDEVVDDEACEMEHASKEKYEQAGGDHFGGISDDKSSGTDDEGPDDSWMYQPPPFDQAELIVMAIICSAEAYLSGEDICDWTFETFPYFYTALTQQQGSMARGRFDQALIDCDIPLIEKQEMRMFPTRVFSTKPCQARMYLARLLEPPRKGAFRFLDLPAELRNRIYEELLVYPGPALALNHSRLSYQVAKRLGEAESNSVRRANDWFAADSPRWTLRLLRTCRQIYKEAMPIYYGLNSFIFTSTGRLGQALRKLSPDRARHIKNIHVFACRFCFRPLIPLSVPRSITSLSLDKLQVSVFECDACDDRCLSNKPKNWIGVVGMELIVAAAVKAQVVETSPQDQWLLARPAGNQLYKYLSDQVRVAGSATKVINSSDESEDNVWE